MPYGGFDCPMYISWGPRPYEFPPVNVATDTCGDLAPTIPPFLDCSLCGLGWPQASGIIDFRLYRDPACPGNESGILNDYSYWHNGAYLPGSFQLQCANAGDNAEPNPNQWVVNKNYNWGSLYKMYCTVTVASLTSVTVTGTIYWLSNIDNQWKTWVTFSQTVTENNPSGNTDPRRPRAFFSTRIPITPAGQYSGRGDITHIAFALATYPQISGCGGELCSMYDGTHYYSCFRAEIIDSGIPPQIRQIGKNTIPCGSQDPYGSWYTDCECDQITLKASGQHETAVNGRPGYAADYGFIGADNPAVNPYANPPYDVVQQIQGTGNLVIKKIGNGPMFIATRLQNTDPYTIVIPTLVQSTSPTIHLASFGSPAWRVVRLYSLAFPNDEILPQACADAIQTLPSTPEGGWWWCMQDDTCVNSPVQPFGSVGGPYSTLGNCQSSCGDQPVLQYWCVDNVCVQSLNQPEGSTSGPYGTLASCQEFCEVAPGEGNYWCLYGNCVQSATSPHATATGPYATSEACAASCSGPAVMVWRCTDNGCGTLTKSGAIMSGYTYYDTEAQCISACPTQYWCVDNSCFQYSTAYTPPSYSAGPFSTLAQCNAECDTGPGWYCVNGTCGYYSSRPPTANGPRYTTSFDCQANCTIIEEQMMSINPAEQMAIDAAQSPASGKVDNSQRELVKRFKLPCVNRGSRINNGKSGFT